MLGNFLTRSTTKIESEANRKNFSITEAQDIIDKMFTSARIYYFLPFLGEKLIDLKKTLLTLTFGGGVL